eukprot:TRINITY_DN12866_c0_g1_i1.p1 TRINITY_DN12866_c0_g1~~TRINITY_DN12866_c0_g1_i1.p1  ORF type:complete len:310 (+),score=49.98 TRINITY_DN12866_c0_g1_i1:282-1211(+)
MFRTCQMMRRQRVIAAVLLLSLLVALTAFRGVGEVEFLSQHDTVDTKKGPNQYAFVTGANKGIGSGIVRRLCELQFKVLIGVRDDKKAKAVQEDNPTCHIEPVIIDLKRMWGFSAGRSFESVRMRLKELNAVITHSVLNAGTNSNPPYTKESADEIITINYFGTKGTLEAIAPFISKGGSVILVSSNFGQLKHIKSKSVRKSLSSATTTTDVTSIANDYRHQLEFNIAKATSGAMPYAMSKNLVSAYVRAQSNSTDQYLINAVHPGSISTTMNPNGKKSTKHAAFHICNTLIESTTSGGFYHDGRKLKW